MVFQGLDRGQAEEIWQPSSMRWSRSPQDFALDFAPLKIVSTRRDFLVADA